MAKSFKELTKEERQRQQRRQGIARLWAEGESCRAIGERFGLTRQAVHDILRRMENGPVTPGFAQLVRRWPGRRGSRATPCGASCGETRSRNQRRYGPF